jgi:hypothetical protein
MKTDNTFKVHTGTFAGSHAFLKPLCFIKYLSS